MSKVNWSRVVGCGLLAGIIWIILGSGVTALLGRDFALPNNNLGKSTSGFLVFNIVLDLLEGISILWLYAAIRPRYRPGAKTADVAAFAWWFHRHSGRCHMVFLRLFPAEHSHPAHDRNASGACHSYAGGCQVSQGMNWLG